MKKTKSIRSPLGVTFLLTGLLLCSRPPLLAQTRLARVAIFTLARTLTTVHEGLEDGLAQRGYKQGENITYIVEDTNGSSSNLASRIPTLLAAKPDVIFAVSTVHALVAKRATSTVPIVCAWVADPVKAGLVTDYSDVKSNLTGVAAIGDSLTGKRLEVLLEVAPKIKRLLVVVATTEGVALSAVRSLENIAGKLGVKLVRRDVTTAAEIKRAIHETPPGSVDAIFYIPSTLARVNIDLLVKKARVDTFSHSRGQSVGSGRAGFLRT